MRLALVMIVAALLAACSDRPRSVVLITVDTLRADHTSAHGYDQDTTPELAALGAAGTRFHRCISHFPETGPSLSAVLTSRYPRETGVRDHGICLPEEFPTLPESFARAGYATAAFVSTYLLKPDVCGLDRGFAVYDHDMDAKNLGRERFERRAEDTVQKAVEWLDRARPGRYFLWVHLYDPHGLYDPGARLARRFYRDTGRPDLDPAAIPWYQRYGDVLDPDDYTARYDGEIRRADAAVGDLLRRVGPDALVIFTSDHGEGLGEHDYWFRHGSRLDDPALHVPLVMSGPGVPAGVEVDRLVRLIDLAPTILDLCDLDPLPGARGVSLVPLFAGDPPGEPPIAFSEARRKEYLVSATTADHRLLLRPDTGEQWLFDLRADPGETHDIRHAERELAPRLEAELRAWLGAADRGGAGQGGGELDRALESLGYLRSGGVR